MESPISEQPDNRDAVGVLADRNRRALYDFVIGEGTWTSREQAAVATGLERGVTSHHLDRLADEGLLEVDYRRLNDRRGPGAGRPAKVYRRSPAEIAVTLPPRDYEVAGRVLAEATVRCQREGSSIDEAIDVAARSMGTTIGAQARRQLGRRTAVRAVRERVFELLRLRGYEPELVAGDAVVLHNCPFHHLAQSYTELICGMNLSLLEGVLDEIATTGWCARLQPQEGLCCVRLQDENTLGAP